MHRCGSALWIESMPMFELSKREHKNHRSRTHRTVSSPSFPTFSSFFHPSPRYSRFLLRSLLSVYILGFATGMFWFAFLLYTYIYFLSSWFWFSTWALFFECGLIVSYFLFLLCEFTLPDSCPRVLHTFCIQYKSIEEFFSMNSWVSSLLFFFVVCCVLRLSSCLSLFNIACLLCHDFFAVIICDGLNTYCFNVEVSCTTCIE